MSPKIAEPKPAAVAPLAPKREERASNAVEGRISLWASQAAANERNSTIAERRFSLHINRRSIQNLRVTISEDAVEASGEPNSGDKEKLLKAEEPPSEEEGKPIVFKSELHREMHALVTSYIWEMFIFEVIMVNTLILMVQASINIEARAGWYLELMETVFVGIFLSEAVVMLYVYRLRYWHSFFHCIDFFIVFFNIVDMVLRIFEMKLGIFGATTIFRLLRLIRSLRALHLLSLLKPFKFFSTLQVILVTIQRSLVPMGILAIMMTYVMYLFAVIGRGLYGELDFRFANIPKTMFTLYIMLTLDDWFFIAMAIETRGVYHCFYYLAIYTFVNVFVFLNLFVAVICDNFASAWLEEIEVQRGRKLKHTGSFSNMQEELEDHDDEESLINAVTSVDGSESSSDDDDDSDGHTIAEFYPDATEEEQQVMQNFFSVAAALENSYYQLLEMQQVLDMMVDVAADASENAV